MSRIGLSVSIALWAGLTFAFFIAGLLFDEDANHWDWPDGQNGPVTATTVKIALAAACVAALPVAVVAWLI